MLAAESTTWLIKAAHRSILSPRHVFFFPVAVVLAVLSSPLPRTHAAFFTLNHDVVVLCVLSPPPLSIVTFPASRGS